MYIPEWIIVLIVLWCAWSALPHLLQELSDSYALNKYCNEIENRRLRALHPMVGICQTCYRRDCLKHGVTR